MKKIFKKVLPERVKNKLSLYFQKNFRSSFSACGEDAILKYLFRNRKAGFYVDVGAYDPFEVSNTYNFYLQGWKGINIDANESAIKKFIKERNKDINVFAAISEEEEVISYFEVTGSKSMNSFSKDFIGSQDVTSIKSEKFLKTRKLSAVLDEYLPSGQKIDFISIDVEGFELKVLRSNNWLKYRPDIILLESFDKMTNLNFDQEVVKYLNNKEYSIISKTPNGIFFIENNQRLNSENSLI